VSIDWAALGIVAVVSVVMTLVFVLLLSGGIRFMAAGEAAADQGGGVARTAGITLLVCAALLVLFGIYLILPISN
jgi:ABC-type Fe3+-siderophore transport system permease subunit